MMSSSLQNLGQELYTKRAVVISFIIHIILFQLNITVLAPSKVEDKKSKKELEPIKLTMVSVKKTLVQKVAIPKQKEIATVTPVEAKAAEEPKAKSVVVDAGSEKVVPKSQDLGNPNQTKKQLVQKGDPMSKKHVAYKPGTDVRKLARPNIGTGNPKVVNSTKPGTGASGGTKALYKGFNFQEAADGLYAKGSQTAALKGGSGIWGKGAGNSGGAGNGEGGLGGQGGFSGHPNGTVKSANVATNVGSFTGAAVGKIDSSKGAEGLSQRGSVMVANIPTNTVVLGSIDPDIIRQLISDHRPQFRYCYQSELDKGLNSSDLQGVVRLNFVIANDGRVVESKVTSDALLTNPIRDCVKNVLEGIQFPSPKGGGKVEVSQPINFFPKKF